MRPSIKELYGLAPEELLGIPHEIAIKKKIDAVRRKKKETAILLRNATSYEEISGLNASIRYYEKTIKGKLEDLEELGIIYGIKETV